LLDGDLIHLFSLQWTNNTFCTMPREWSVTVSQSGSGRFVLWHIHIRF